MVILCPLIDTIDTSNRLPNWPRVHILTIFFSFLIFNLGFSQMPRHHHHHHHHHRKKRHKRKILVHDLDEQSVKVSTNVINSGRSASATICSLSFLSPFAIVSQVIDPDDLSQRARWTIIATACLLLVMCLLLVGVTLRMAPLIDDMGK